MRAMVVIATSGRPDSVATLLHALSGQTLPPSAIVVVGASEADITGVRRHPLVNAGVASLHVSPLRGLTRQRNLGLDHLRTVCGLTEARDAFVAFFDDDFRPDSRWLEAAATRFDRAPDVVALTGRVLADGVNGVQLSDADAEAYLYGGRAPEPHWSDRPALSSVKSCYGCNMAFVGPVAHARRFDEHLPLYGWQEDRDYTGQALAYGQAVIEPACRGVHLGLKAARTSGDKFGYSQIVNPVHIAMRGNMSWARAAWFLGRAVIANTIRSIRRHALFDYRGRLRGNLIALADLARLRCTPQRILTL